MNYSLSDQHKRMEEGGVKKKNSGKRQSMNYAENSTMTEVAFQKRPRKATEASGLEGSGRKSFNLEHEVSRQDEIVEFLGSNDSSVDDIRRLGESTRRLLCEIIKIANARGDRMNVQISFVSVPYPEVIVAMKQAIEGLIDDVEEVKNTILSRKKLTSPAQSVMAVGKGLHDRKWNVVLHELTRSFCQPGNQETKQEKAANAEPGKGVTQQDEDVLESGIPETKTPMLQDTLE